MSNETTPEDMERTVRLDTKKIMDPYDTPTSTSVDSIEDLYNSDAFADTPDISFSLPEEDIISSPESVDFDELTKEMNELSNEFELNVLEKEQTKEQVQATALENKPIETKAFEKISDTSTKETAPNTSISKTKEDTILSQGTPPTNKKEAREAAKEIQSAIAEKVPMEKAITEKIGNASTKQDFPITNIQKPKQNTASNPDTPSTDKKEVKKVVKDIQSAIAEEVPMKKAIIEKIGNANTKQDFPKTNIQKPKQNTTSNPDTPPTDKKEIKKTKEAAFISVPKKAGPNTRKTSNGITTTMLFISLIALLAGGFGVWASMSSQAQIDSLSIQLNTMQNNHLSNQSELVTIQKEQSALKEELMRLQGGSKTPTLPDDSKTNIIQPLQGILPATITPTTPIKEVKPASLKNTWNVIISSHNSMQKAKKEQQREAIKGIETSIIAVVVKGKNWYRIVGTGFADKQQAVNFTHKLKQQGIADAWVQYNK